MDIQWYSWRFFHVNSIGCIQSWPSNPEFEPIFCPQEMAIQIGSEVCGRCVGLVCLMRDVWYPMTLKWDDLRLFMIPWSSSKNDGAVPMIFRWCGTWGSEIHGCFRCLIAWWMAGEWNEQLRALRARVANWKTSVGSCPQVVCSRGSLSQHACQHVVSISDARFHPFQQILGRECDEVWMPQRVGVFYPTAVHGGQIVNPSPKANVSGFDPSWIYFCWDNKWYAKSPTIGAASRRRAEWYEQKLILQTKRL